MKKLCYKIVGLITLFFIFLFYRVPRILAEDFEFDPGGTIKKTLNLPESSPESITIKTIQWALGLLGLAAVVMILIGGIIWMTSAGNEEKVRKAKTILTSAITGLVIILLAWAIFTFVVGTVKNVTE